MVGKGPKPKSSRIFQLCYLKCCKSQNLTPLTNVIPSGNGKVLDFCVDRIKYADWAPILNALSCDLSLHSVSIKCRQQVKTVLVNIDTERLAKTVNKRCVLLTKFMLSNLMDATAQLLSNTTLLTSLMLEGLPLKTPYLEPLCEALLANSSLQHIHLQRCQIGDVGCQAICKSIRSQPNILTLDLTGCELTPLGAEYIAELVKFQKIHRYSENWTHTLRYRTPEPEAVAGLRRITLCANPQLGDTGICKLLDVLSDDLWIKGQYCVAAQCISEGFKDTQKVLEKSSTSTRLDSPANLSQKNEALDVQDCGLTENTTAATLQLLKANKTLLVIDLRNNDVSLESLSEVLSALRGNETGTEKKLSWLASASGSSTKNCDKMLQSVPSKNEIPKDRPVINERTTTAKYVSNTGTEKKDKDYTEILEQQLQEEISHRQQLEKLTALLAHQNKQLKQQQIRPWGNGATSSGSEHSFEASERSSDLSNRSASSSTVLINQKTLSYIQQACKDIYAFLKNNQCYGISPHGKCIREPLNEQLPEQQAYEGIAEVKQTSYSEELQVNIVSKRSQSSHKMLEKFELNKTTKSAHFLGDSQRVDAVETTLEMIEKQMGDTIHAHSEDSNTLEENKISAQSMLNTKNMQSSPCSSVASDSDTLICSSQAPQRFVHPALINPRDALYSSSSEDSS